MENTMMSPKPIPQKLGIKLRKIREYLGLTLDDMADLLKKRGDSRRSRVYEWENGIRQPDYISLLAYARLVNINVDMLIDDSIDLLLQDK